MRRVLLLTPLLLLAFSGSAYASYSAELMYSKTPIYKNAGGRQTGFISNYTHSGSRARLMVLGLKGKNDRIWVRVRLANRPNTSKAWVDSERVSIHRVNVRVTIDRSQRRLWFFRDGKKVFTTRVVVGAYSTPTPLGKFALWDRYRPPASSSFLRPYVLETTAHSNQLKKYEGGEGRVALHGMRGALIAPLGSAVSHGCVRNPDWALTRLYKGLPLGAPITVRG